MGKLSRLLSIAALASCFTAAHAITYFNLASSDTTLVGFSGTSMLTVGGPAIGPANVTNQIDFFPNSLKVGDGTGISSKDFSFTYQVGGADPATSGIGLVLQGIVGGSGRITALEQVFRINADNSETLVATLGNTITATGTTDNRGSLTFAGDSYSYSDNEGFLPALTNYKIKKSFSLQVNPNYNPAVDFASITLVEQNHQAVPEPASCAVVAAGISGLLARRRRKA